jgi:hypothetical protein
MVFWKKIQFRKCSFEFHLNKIWTRINMSKLGYMKEFRINICQCWHPYIHNKRMNVGCLVNKGFNPWYVFIMWLYFSNIAIFWCMKCMYVRHATYPLNYLKNITDFYFKFVFEINQLIKCVRKLWEKIRNIYLWVS